MTDPAATSLAPAAWAGLLPPLRPPDSERWTRRIDARLALRPAPLEAAERAELWDCNRRLFGDDETAAAPTRAAIGALGRSDALAVVTGQQPGLLGGPIYSFAKAAGALLLAHRLTRLRGGAPVVPIFWIAGDDHDFDEAAVAAWPSAHGSPTSLRLAARPENAGRPLFDIPFGAENLAALLEALRDAVPTERLTFDPEPLLRAATDEGAADLETVFGRLLAQFFAGTGLVFVAPRLGFLRRRAAPILAREFADPLATTRAVLAAHEALRAAGRAPQLHRHPDAVNAFLLVDGVRCRLTYTVADGSFRALRPGADTAEADEAARLAPAEALALLAAEPERFSPNVVTRPVVQDAALPSVTYVGGPAELAYFDEIADVYALHGVHRPEPVARPRLWLVEPPAGRALEKLGLTTVRFIEAVAAGPEAIESLRRAALATEQADALDAALAAARNRIDAAIDGLAEALPGQATATRQSLQKSRKSLEASLDKLAEAAARDREQLGSHRLAAWEKVAAALLPGGVPQERVGNPIAPGMMRWGGDLPARLLAAMARDADAAQHIIALADL